MNLMNRVWERSVRCYMEEFIQRNEFFLASIAVTNRVLRKQLVLELKLADSVFISSNGHTATVTINNKPYRIVFILKVSPGKAQIIRRMFLKI